jgi:tRNA threonylcarbamoyladenosine biosynthesis protein TsaB
MTVGGPLLAIDTATTRAVVALGTPDGALLVRRSWVAGYRHGEELLSHVDQLLREAGVEPSALGGLVVGTGPGAFTGLRVGIATAKGLAHALDLPIVGVATSGALLESAAAASSLPRSTLALLQPAGLADRVLTRDGEAPRIVPGGTEPELSAATTLIAVDLAGRAPVDAVARGEAAHDGLAAALLAAGAARLAAGDADDLARLAPEYVTLPRGVRAAAPDGGVELSGGRRTA